LNDDVINHFGLLFMKVSDHLRASPQRFYVASSYALEKVSNGAQGDLASWFSIRKLDFNLLDLDIVLFPLNTPRAPHWSAVSVDFNAASISLLDSSPGCSNREWAQLAATAIRVHAIEAAPGLKRRADEAQLTFERAAGRDGYEDDDDPEAAAQRAALRMALRNEAGRAAAVYERARRFASTEPGWNVQTVAVPHQANGYDCGVFMLANIVCRARGRPFRYSQADITSIRQQLAFSILDGDLHL